MGVAFLKMRTSVNPSGLNPEDKMREEGIKFLQVLYKNCKGGFVEYRPLPADKKNRRWIDIDDIDLPHPPDGKNVYFGVASREYGRGTKEDIQQIPAVWIDVDLLRTNRDDFQGLLHEFSLRPSMIVATGGGWHLYWRLKIPAGREDIPRVEEINKRLAHYFGGDPAATDASRVMRLPGTWNLKYMPPQLAGVVRWNQERQYSMEDLENILPTIRKDAPKVNNDADSFDQLLEGVEQGHRNEAAAILVGRYLQKGLTKREIYGYMTSWNENNSPPLDKQELRTVIESVSRTHDRGSSVESTLPTEYLCNLISDSVLGVNEFLESELPDHPYIMYPWLNTGTIALISSERGVGKTFLCLSISLAVTHGLHIGDWKTITPVGVLYLDGEMPPHILQNRLSLLKSGMKAKEKAPLAILSTTRMKAKGHQGPNLASSQWRHALGQFLVSNPQYKVLVLDNIGSLAPGIDENTKKDWDPINQWFLELRSVGISIVMVHHKGKKGDQRGTSAREDNIDVAFELKRPPNYKAQDGATFNVKPTKTRSFYGDDAVPFNFRVFTCREGYSWQTDSCSKGGRENFWEILSLLHEGKRQKEIAEIVDCSAARVSQVKKEAKEKGFLNENDKLTERGVELYESFRAEIKYKEKNK